MCRRFIALILSLSLGTALADGLSFDDALQQAEAHAPGLRAAEARRASAAEAVAAADALPDPRAFVGLENVPVEGPDRFSLQSDFMTLQTVGVMQEFPNAGKRRARAAMAEAEVGTEEATVRLTRIQVRQETAAAWLKRYYLERRREVLSSLQQENQTLQQAVTAQVSAGRKRPVDALLARQEALALADQQDEIERELATADAMLRRWTGAGAASLAGAPPNFTDDPEAWRSHVQHHPALQRFKPEADRVRAELHEAEAGRRPDWGVELAWQNRGNAFGDMMSLQVSADLPLFSRTRQSPRIRAKQHQLASVEAEQDTMRREHQAALEGDIAMLIALKRQRDRLEKQVIPLVQERVALELAAYRTGTGELATVLGARQELLALQLKQLGLRADYDTRLAGLHYLFAHQETRP